jgi:hypothetical protein
LNLEQVTLTDEQAAAVRASASPGAMRGPIIVAGFLLVAGIALGAALHPLLGLLLILGAVALVVGLVRSLGLPHADAGRREGLRIEGPWILVRAELEEAGSVPPRVLWSLRTVLPKPIEVPPEVGAEVDPEGAERLAARLDTGQWPGGERLPVVELSGDDAEIVVGRRSHALAQLNVR